MRAPRITQVAFAAGAIGLGVLCLVYDDFAPVWQPVPRGFPWRGALAYASGIFLLAFGMGLLFKRVAARCALALAGYHLLWVIVRGAQTLPHPMNIGLWEALCESLLPLVGGWVLAVSLAKSDGKSMPRLLPGETGMHAARLLFGLCCVVFGLSHFKYTEVTTGMVPRWLPARVGLAYLTGAGHIAAGLGVLTGLGARLAATLEAVMLTSFVLLVHLPSLGMSPPPAWGPDAQSRWGELLIAILSAASAGIVAASLGDRPWGLGTRSGASKA